MPLLPCQRCRRSTLIFLTTAIVFPFPALFATAAPPAESVACPPFAADRAALARVLPNTTLEDLPGGLVAAVPASTVLASPDTDPRFGQRFDRVLLVYAPRTGAKGFFRTITFHYQAKELPQALRLTRLAARLLRLHREHFGRDTAFGRDEETADVWLSDRTAPGGSTIGGETHGSQVYLWAMGTVPRTPLEWTRTLCHEWGHLTLPAARGFSSPEGDAAGYLGERLYEKWLHDDPQTTTDDGSTPADLEVYYRRQVAPLMGRWRQQDTGGPNSPLLDGTDTRAMDFYIGAALASDDAFGSAILGRALWTVLDSHPRDFLRSLARNTARATTLTVRLPAWTPLTTGHYTAFPAEPGAAGMVAFGGSSAPQSVSGAKPATVRVGITEWRLIRAVRGTVGRIALRRQQSTENRTQP